MRQATARRFRLPLHRACSHGAAATLTASLLVACGGTEASSSPGQGKGQEQGPRFDTACSALSEAMVRDVFEVDSSVEITRAENEFVRKPVPKEITSCNFSWETAGDAQFSVSLFAYFNPPRNANALHGKAQIDSLLDNTFQTKVTYEPAGPLDGHSAAYAGRQNSYINSDELHWHFGGRERLKLQTTVITADKRDVLDKAALVRMAQRINAG